jgi:hypothetical protein
MSLVLNRINLAPAPPLFRSFIDLIRYVRIAVFVMMLGVSLFLTVRPRWWGKLLCAFAGLAWIGFRVVGLTQGQFDLGSSVRTIQLAGMAMMRCDLSSMYRSVH